MKGVPLRYSFRNLGRRPTRTLLTLGGLGLLVALIVFVMAFGRSIGLALRLPGDPRNLVVLSKKAQTMELSAIPTSELDLMSADVANDLETGPDGSPLFSREVFHFVTVRTTEDENDEGGRGLMHGMAPHLVEPLLVNFELTEGALPEEGLYQAIVGRGVASKLRVPEERLAVGQSLYVRNEVFEIVGRFEAPGTLMENWIISHPADLSQMLNRQDYSFGRMKVRPDVDMNALATRLSLDERYQVKALPEAEYFADFATGFRHFQEFSILLSIVLAVGGILTGMNTMHNAVSGRIREIGVLRVLGFSKTKIFVAFLLEAVALSLVAGVLGCALGLLTNGLPLRVPFAATFPVVVDLPVMAVGVGAALLMGLLGLAFPLLTALRRPPVDAVRAVG
jgi:ABC-type antimicrobial peptide transport system permease subunit